MIWSIVVFIGLWILAYNCVNGWASLAFIAAALAICSASGKSVALSGFVWTLFIAVVIVLKVAWVRCRLISAPVLRIMRKTMPAVSRTEREALEAGNVWWDAELFSGNPNWSRLLNLAPATLSAEERSFLDGPVEELCKMLDDWDITHNRNDLPPEIWDYIKQNKFFSMIIPKRYGGLEFSVYAHSEVVMKVASRSITAGVTIMVPNSLGPGKLLLDYGTEAQKDYY